LKETVIARELALMVDGKIFRSGFKMRKRSERHGAALYGTGCSADVAALLELVADALEVRALAVAKSVGDAVYSAEGWLRRWSGRSGTVSP